MMIVIVTVAWTQNINLAPTFSPCGIDEISDMWLNDSELLDELESKYIFMYMYVKI